MSQPPSVGVGMVGYAFMGRAHSQAWRTVDRVFELPLRPRLAAICGRDQAAAESAAARLGWAATETDWRALIARDDVQLIDIAAPGSLHAPIAIAALQAGKHVLCEKPLANTLAEAERMAAAADAAFPSGARAMVGFNYRRVPALALARRPRLLVLDEPMASLDPLARHDFMATAMTAMADDGVSVVLSSHVLTELERVADYLVLLSRGSVQVAGEVDDLLASHRVLTGPAAEAGRYAERLGVVHARRGGAQAHLLIRTNGSTDPVPPGWEAHPVSLEELTLAYLREPGAASLPGPARAERTEVSP